MREYKATIREHVKYQFDNLPDKIILEVVEPKSSTRSLMEKIQKRGDSYVVTDSSGKKVLGKHKTKSAALKQIAAVEASKAARMDEGLRDIGRGLAKGASTAALAAGIGLATKPEPPSIPNTDEVRQGEVRQLESGPTQKITYSKETGINTAKKVVDKNKEPQATLDDHVNHLREYEGFRSKVYDDHKGNPTVGFGHMFKSDSKETWEGAGIGHLHDRVKAGKAKLSEADATRLLHHELENTYLPRVRKLLPRYDDLDKDSQIAALGSTFRGGFAGSPKTVGHLNNGDFETGADEFLKNAEYIKSKREGTGVHKRMDLYHNSWKKGRYVR